MGTQGLEILTSVLHNDRWIITNILIFHCNTVVPICVYIVDNGSCVYCCRNDVEILSYALDCLCNLLSNEPLDDGNLTIYPYGFNLLFYIPKCFFKSTKFEASWLTTIFAFYFTENEANKAPVNTTTDLGIVFTEMFAKSPANVTQLLSLLEVPNCFRICIEWNADSC